MNIGVYRYSALGDIAASIPVLKAFVKEPIVLTSPLGYELVKDEFETIIVQRSKGVVDLMKFLWEAKQKVELFVDLQNNDRSRFLRLFFDSVSNKGVSFNQSVTHIFYDIAKKSSLVGELDTSFTPKERSYIVLNTGSSPKWISKRLPLHKWREFSEVLYERFGLPFVLTGDKNEVEYVQEVAKVIVGNKEVIAGKTTISDLKKVLKEAFLVVSTDSAPMHIAAVQKTPTIGLFGATNWVISAPYGPWSIALHDPVVRLPENNRLEVGNYYEGIDITDGLDRLASYLKATR